MWEGKMTRISVLRRQQAKLMGDIGALLDGYLIGTIAQPPSLAGHNLTTKVDGRTVTRYVRKDVVPFAREMTRRYKELWLLLQNLSKINWEILNVENR